MTVTKRAVQELLFVAINGTSPSNTSVANHGAAATPSIGGNITIGSRLSVDIEVFCPYLSTTAGTPSFHVMIDGSADANCQCESAITGPTSRKFRYTFASAGVHSVAVFLKSSSAGTVSFLVSAVNPGYLRVVEV